MRHQHIEHNDLWTRLSRQGEGLSQGGRRQDAIWRADGKTVQQPQCVFIIVDHQYRNTLHHGHRDRGSIALDVKVSLDGYAATSSDLARQTERTLAL